MSGARLPLALKFQRVSRSKADNVPLIPPNSASISPACKMILLAPISSSTFKEDILGSDRPSAVAAAGVRHTRFSVSSRRVLCVILQTSLFTTAPQQFSNSR